jgi:integrase
MWQFRWWEFDKTGKRVQRSRLIGSVTEYPTAKSAQPAVDALRLEINANIPKAVPVTVGTLITRYLNDPLEMSRLAYSTKQSYTTHFNNWIRLKWGSFTLEQVRPMAVERWLLELTLAPRTKVHVRNLMHVLFKCAQRWELIPNNPISLVHQGGHRRKEPDILTVKEFQALRRELSPEGLRRLGLPDEQFTEREFTHARARMMTILAVCLGLTRSEFTALKWSDFD